ncbi:MAG: acylphosphatase [Phycisphaerae bacterium]|nr:acylphosphatase [Phycisphaerae bacterium]
MKWFLSDRDRGASVWAVLVGAVVCLAGACSSSGGDEAAAELKVDTTSRTVVLTAVVAEHKAADADAKASKPPTLEYLLVASGGKADKAALVTQVRPAALRQALVSVGLEPGKAVTGADQQLDGPKVRIVVQYEASGKKKSHDAARFIATAADGKPLDETPWVFTGSRETTTADGASTIEAEATGSLVGLHAADASSLIGNARPEASKPAGTYQANTEALPAAGTEVRVAIQRVDDSPRRVHVFVSGRVQGVGFRNFVTAGAQKLKLTGWVRNLNDGRVEAVVEGPAEAVGELLAQMRRGPREANVTDLKVEDEKPTGEFKAFTRKPNG